MYSTWEYMAIDIYDKWGAVDVNVINQKLNELGSQGWHLVTAYTNELGKNGIAIGGVGINTTVDQSIFIFEREILKETKEEIEARIQLKKEQEKLAEQKKMEALKESIKCYDDLLNNPQIKEEADMLLKMYGESAYKNYLAKKANELGIN